MTYSPHSILLTAPVEHSVVGHVVRGVVVAVVVMVVVMLVMRFLVVPVIVAVVVAAVVVAVVVAAVVVAVVVVVVMVMVMAVVLVTVAELVAGHCCSLMSRPGLSFASRWCWPAIRVRAEQRGNDRANPLPSRAHPVSKRGETPGRHPQPATGP